MHIIAEGI